MIGVVKKMLLTPKSVNNMLNTKFNVAGWRKVNPVRPMVLRRRRWEGEGKGRKQERNSENFLFTTINKHGTWTYKKKKIFFGVVDFDPIKQLLLPSLSVVPTSPLIVVAGLLVLAGLTGLLILAGLAGLLVLTSPLLVFTGGSLSDLVSPRMLNFGVQCISFTDLGVSNIVLTGLLIVLACLLIVLTGPLVLTGPRLVFAGESLGDLVSPRALNFGVQHISFADLGISNIVLWPESFLLNL